MKPRESETEITNKPTKNYAIGIASVIVIIICAFLVIHRQSPPEVRPASATVTEFASGRAMEHLKVIARKPHPIGSAEHSEVRNYILKELTGMGLSPEVQGALVLNLEGGDSYSAANVQNIIGRIVGADSRRVVLLVCHYDSAPTSPGASDDGASVAAFLEVVRKLKAGSPLKNDVVCLFTDGEEDGMLGAKAFMDEHPCAKDVAVVLNFEARGIRGPSIMFETSEGNDWLIKEFADAAERPVANSLTQNLYRLLPNATDMTIFKSGGLQGLNFAYISGLSYYHTAGDSYENIDERSLQHQGAFALGLARHFGNVSNWPARAGNAVYFDIFSSAIISYSERWVIPLMAIGLALFVGLLFLGLRLKRLTIRGIAFGAFAFLLNVISVGALMMVTWRAIQSVSSHPRGSNYDSSIYAIGFMMLTVALSSALLVWSRKKTRIENITVGALFWWAVLMVIFSLLVPGGSYLFTWPLLLMVSALGAVFILKEDLASTKGMIVLTLSALSGVILIAPLISLMIAGFGVELVWVFMAFAVFLIALHYAHMNLIITAKKWLLPFVTGLLGLCFVVTGVVKNDISLSRPKRNHVFYALNADTGKAIWGSADQNVDEWTGQFFSSGAERAYLADYFPWGRGDFLKGDAPQLSLIPPAVVVLDDSTKDGVRTLRLRVTSPRQAPALSIYWKQELKADVTAVNGKRVSEAKPDAARSSEGYRRISYSGLSNEGFELSLEIKSSGPVELKVDDWSYGLPEIPNYSYKSRPDYIVASPLLFSDCTVVTKTVKL